MAGIAALGAEEDPVGVDRHDPPPGLQRDLDDGPRLRVDPGVVDEDVEAPVFRLHAVDRMPAMRPRRSRRGAETGRVPPAADDGLNDAPGRGLRPVPSPARPRLPRPCALPTAAPSPLVAPVTIATLPASLAIASPHTRVRSIAYVAILCDGKIGDNYGRLYSRRHRLRRKRLRTAMAQGNRRCRRQRLPGGPESSGPSSRRSAPWLTEDDAERLSGFGAWVATAVEEQADYTNRFAPPVLETPGRGRAGALGRPPQSALCRGSP